VDELRYRTRALVVVYRRKVVGGGDFEEIIYLIMAHCCELCESLEYTAFAQRSKLLGTENATFALKLH
jgi:hypothetical protein